MMICASKSLCPVCLKVIPAELINEQGSIYMEKSCPEHGHFKVKHPWHDQRDYQIISGLKDNLSLNNSADGLVLNLNSKCNQQCPFCFARSNELSELELSLGEVAEAIKKFKGSSVYLCGGEPTLRPDIFEIIRLIKNAGFIVLLFTNGKKLTDEKYVDDLKKTGLDMVILQFDTLNEDHSQEIRGERLVQNKFKVLSNLEQAGIPVYLFTMIVQGINHNEIKALFDLATERNLIKIINFNPVWEAGRLGDHQECSASDVMNLLEQQTALSRQDFAESTYFGFYLFELLNKISSLGGRKQPMCEMRCYLICHAQGYIPISKIFNLPKINAALKRILNSFNSGKKWPNRLILIRELIVICAILCFNIRTIGWMVRLLPEMLWRLVFKKSRFHFLSVIVGTFHTEQNIDLNMVETCNLFSSVKNEAVSSCLRQIYYLRGRIAELQKA